MLTAVYIFPNMFFDPFKSIPLQVLSRLEKLEELKCGGCLLGDAGADHLAKGIADISGLKVNKILSSKNVFPKKILDLTLCCLPTL